MWLKQTIENVDTISGRVFDLFIQFLIVISLVSFCVETLPNLSKDVASFLSLLETITVIIFTIEYLMRLTVADRRVKFVFSFFGLIDLLAILPFYIASGVDLRSVRIFRMFRLFRMLKILRFSSALKRFRSAFYLVRAELVVFLSATMFLLFVAAVGIYYFENPAQPDKFSSVFQCLWWAVATLTTIGYGDIYPITVGGKIFTSFIAVVGIGFVAVPTGLMASALTHCIEAEKNE